MMNDRLIRLACRLIICVLTIGPTGLLATTRPAEGSLKIGWSSTDITPQKPVLIAGQFHARLSESVMDPLYATVLALESGQGGKTTRTILVGCDLIGIPDGMRDASNLRDRVRELVVGKAPELTGTDITLNGSHTHTAPLSSAEDVNDIYGVPLEMISSGKPVMSPKDYMEFAAQRIAEGVVKAWKNRKPGGISFGLSKAVLGHNRLQVDKTGKSLMYGNTSRPEFSHIEGYEDHNLNLIYTWDQAGKLTGVVVNAAVPSQVTESMYQISADYWNETRALLREELGKELYVLPQVSAAGDQSPHLMWETKAEERMQKLMGIGNEGVGRSSLARRRQLARYVTDGVKAILPYMKANIDWNPVLSQKTETVRLSRRLLGEKDLEDARKEIAEWQPKYEKMLAEARANPEMTKKPRWYTNITIANTRFRRGQSVLERYELEKKSAKLGVELKVIRIGDMAIASNPFELYLDYGIQMKVKSPAVQTFIVQLTGAGTYLPTQRSINGGAYGAVPASTLFGPEAGNELVEKTVSMLKELW
ncbi:hypothetical protein [Ravibacter arvi]